MATHIAAAGASLLTQSLFAEPGRAKHFMLAWLRVPRVVREAAVHSRDAAARERREHARQRLRLRSSGGANDALETLEKATAHARTRRIPRATRALVASITRRNVDTGARAPLCIVEALRVVFHVLLTAPCAFEVHASETNLRTSKGQLRLYLFGERNRVYIPGSLLSRRELRLVRTIIASDDNDDDEHYAASAAVNAAIDATLTRLGLVWLLAERILECAPANALVRLVLECALLAESDVLAAPELRSMAAAVH